MSLKTKPEGIALLPEPAALRIHGTIARDLGIAIVAGRYRPGEILHGEIDASDRLKVSRTAYREAIRILVAKGLVESRPKTGTRVTERSRWQLLDPAVLEWMFEYDPDADLLENLFELRRIIEPQAAGLAAKRRTAVQIEKMRASLDAMGAHTLHDAAGRSADREFHAVLLEASGNAFIMSLTSGISAAIAWTTEYKERVSSKRFNADPLPAHQSVLEAIVARDSQAAIVGMTELVDTACVDALKARKSRPRMSARRRA